MQAIILAGGKGSRLKPFTTSLPKPLVPVDDMPILEVVLRQLKSQGFKKVVIAVNHLARLIMAFFGDGRKMGLDISYSIEDNPLGTAGPLTLIDNLDKNFLVMNGDLLTTVNFADMFRHHVRNCNDITIATHQKKVTIDLGVLELRKDDFVKYIEKPTYSFAVSTGIYIFNKNIISLIPKNKKIDMPKLIAKAKIAGKCVKSYHKSYYWLDIGRPDDYEKANDIFRKKRKVFLPR